MIQYTIVIILPLQKSKKKGNERERKSQSESTTVQPQDAAKYHSLSQCTDVSLLELEPANTAATTAQRNARWQNSQAGKS